MILVFKSNIFPLGYLRHLLVLIDSAVSVRVSSVLHSSSHRILGFHSGLCSILIWFLWSVSNKDQVSVFLMWISFSWWCSVGCPFSHLYIWCLCQESAGWRCGHALLPLVFCSTQRSAFMSEMASSVSYVLLRDSVHFRSYLVSASLPEFMISLFSKSLLFAKYLIHTFTISLNYFSVFRYISLNI